MTISVGAIVIVRTGVPTKWPFSGCDLKPNRRSPSKYRQLLATRTDVPYIEHNPPPITAISVLAGASYETVTPLARVAQTHVYYTIGSVTTRGTHLRSGQVSSWVSPPVPQSPRSDHGPMISAAGALPEGCWRLRLFQSPDRGCTASRPPR